MNEYVGFSRTFRPIKPKIESLYRVFTLRCQGEMSGLIGCLSVFRTDTPTLGFSLTDEWRYRII